MPTGTVTWTGEVGQRPTGRRGRGGPSSAGIMNNLADRQGLSSSSSNTGPIKAKKARDFVPLIQTFITRQGGQAVTKMIVEHFKSLCKDNKEQEEFKKALDICAEIFKQGSRGRSIWRLKAGYK